jgi:hypothetical protein
MQQKQWNEQKKYLVYKLNRIVGKKLHYNEDYTLLTPELAQDKLDEEDWSESESSSSDSSESVLQEA